MTSESMRQLVIAGLIGLLSGTHTAIWGMFKDAMHEGFTVDRFSRSILIGALVAIWIESLFHFPLPAPGAAVLVFGLSYAAERGLVEVWKTFLREEDQAKYFIPMQFSLRGVPVKSRAARLAFGVAYVAILTLCLSTLARVHIGGQRWPVVAAVAAGLLVGLVIAVGGAWKDAPKEGFELLKFFRSPAMTVTYAILMSRLTTSMLVIAVAAIGFERATAETYKTFFFPSKPRGKFSGKPVLYPSMVRRRRYFVPAYVAISAAAIVALVLAVAP
jgi:hypothetical protein